jgi:hypothetical protein
MVVVKRGWFTGLRDLVGIISRVPKRDASLENEMERTLSAPEDALQCELNAITSRNPRIQKRGGLYENAKLQQALHRRRSTMHADHGVKCSGAKRRESAYFIQHQRDPLHAWFCLQM